MKFSPKAEKTAIIAFLKILLKSEKIPEARKEILSRMKAELENLKEVTEESLNQFKIKYEGELAQ